MLSSKHETIAVDQFETQTFVVAKMETQNNTIEILLKFDIFGAVEVKDSTLCVSSQIMFS